MPKRRTKGDGGLTQRHDHPDCPAAIAAGVDDRGKPIAIRPEHACRGRWAGTVDALDASGRRRRKYVYGRTQKEAANKLREAVRQRDAGTLVLGSMTTEAWLRHWLSTIAAPTLKPRTLGGYEGYLETHLIPRVGKHRLSDLRPEHIRMMHAAMAADGKSPATVRQAHAILRKALGDAMRDGKITSNPAERVKTPSAPKNHRKGLTLEEGTRLLRSTDEVRWWLAAFYGMRQGECLGLRWGDVDFDAKVIRIEQTLQSVRGGGLQFGTPKSASSRRTIPLLPIVEARFLIALDGASGDGEPDPESLVFGRGGKPVPPRADYDDWHAALLAAECPKIALHAARNSAASLMEAAGIPDRMVAQILGHSSVQITHGYQDAELARMRSALEQMARMVAPALQRESESPATPQRELPESRETP